MTRTKYKNATPTKNKTFRLYEHEADVFGCEVIAAADFAQAKKECQFWGAILLSEDSAIAWQDANTLLDEESFAFEPARRAWKSVTRWVEKHGDKDLPLLDAVVLEDQDISFASYCLDLHRLPSSHLGWISKILYEKKREREYREVLRRDQERRAVGLLSSMELHETLQVELREWEDGDLLVEEESNADVLQTLMMDAILMASGEKKRAVVSTGIDALDDMTGGGFMYGHPEHVILAGRPGKGKSSMARSIAAKCCDVGGVVVMFTGEMSKEQTLAVQMQMETGVDAKGILTGDPRILFSGEGDPGLAAKRMEEAQIRISKRKLVMVDRKLTYKEIPAEVRKAKLKHGRVDLVVVDYLEKYLEGVKEKRVEMAAASDFLLTETKRTGIPNLILAQMNRSIESEKTKEGEDRRDPRLSDLRECGDLEQDATQAWFVDERGVFIAKARFGTTGWVDCRFVPSRSMWR